MRRFRSISDYLSLGAGPSDRKGEPLLGARAVQGPRLFEQRDMVVAERITLKHIRDTIAEMAEAGIPPMTEERNEAARAQAQRLGFTAQYEPLAANIVRGFGPWYSARLPPEDMTALLGDPEFQAGETEGEFRVAGKGLVMVRPPAPRET